jgi:SnoaL-like polyketide cyclase
MATTTQSTSRTTHLLALMKKGDDAFNARDFEGMKAVHHPKMVAHVTGKAEPIKGQPAHAAMIKEMFRIFPDVHVHNDPYPIQFGSGDWITTVRRGAINGTQWHRAARPTHLETSPNMWAAGQADTVLVPQSPQHTSPACLHYSVRNHATSLGHETPSLMMY